MQGPLNNMTVEQAIMAGIQAVCVFAKEKQLELTHIETSHMEIFELISNQELFVIPDDLLEAFRLFNSIHANYPSQANNHSQETNSRKISWIPEHMNSDASYMAKYGLLHLTDLVEMPGDTTLGNLQFYLDRDMGRVIITPDVVIMPLMGLGEVIDGDRPCNFLKRKQVDSVQGCYGGSFDRLVPVKGVNAGMFSPSLNTADVSPTWSITPPVPLPASKGKDKHYPNYAFFENGSLSDKACAILDLGALSQFSQIFREKALDLESLVGMRCMNLLSEMGFQSPSSQVVKDVKVAVGGEGVMGDGIVPAAKKRGRRAASI
ncbi:hypothetical protein ACET3Z_004847 [Daucus carota]